jgi:radical SAM superfamily enzyme YgiQ (UPF0313 family)
LNVLLVSTYELGRQPFGLASPAAWLRSAGFEVECLDLSRDPLDEAAVRRARFIGFYVPMHTATRLAIHALPEVNWINPSAHVCFYGLYAPMNESYLRNLGVETVLGGEFEQELLRAVSRALEFETGGTASMRGELEAPAGQTHDLPTVSLSRLKFIVPDRRGLPDPSRYARLVLPGCEARITGYTEASRGCKHLCRHCPVVPVYQGRFRIVPPDVVLEDIRRQVAAGAQHITFGDPDFFNGIRHAMTIVTAVHTEHPSLTYDVTIKVEHLVQHAGLIPLLRDTGCAFVTTAVESFDDRILARLDKGHTYADFLSVLELFGTAGLALAPTFVAFTPWTTLERYCDFLNTIAKLGLVENVASVQLCMRLLVPAGSRLLELAEIRETLDPFSEAQLMYPWRHPDAEVDLLYERVQSIVEEGLRKSASRLEIFDRVRSAAQTAATSGSSFEFGPLISRAAIPYLTEPWYC